MLRIRIMNSDENKMQEVGRGRWHPWVVVGT